MLAEPFLIPLPPFFRHEFSRAKMKRSFPRSTPDYISRVPELRKQKRKKKGRKRTDSIRQEGIIRFLFSRLDEFPYFVHRRISTIPGRTTSSKWKTFRRGLDDRSKSTPSPQKSTRNARGRAIGNRRRSRASVCVRDFRIPDESSEARNAERERERKRIDS